MQVSNASILEKKYSKLILQISHSEVSFCIIDTLSNKITTFGDFPLEKASNPAEIENSIINFIKQTPILQSKFDDVLVCASHSLPEKIARDLEPWDLHELTAFDDRFLSGFVTESYQIDLRNGFDTAKNVMAPQIRTTVCQHIGGDVQQVTSISSEYNSVTFKHILLPLWISAYRYNDKVYRFMINARTGEVQGERPYSAIKIILFSLTIIAIGVGIWYFATHR